MPKASRLLVGAFVLAAISFAQDFRTVKPETVGLSSERLERIGTAVQRSIDDKRIAGAVTLVVRRGQIGWFKAQGMEDREAGKPMRPDAIFRICSMTKPITSLAVMMLYEEGHFLLEDPVSKYLPEFKNAKVFVQPRNRRALFHSGNPRDYDSRSSCGTRQGSPISGIRF